LNLGKHQRKKKEKGVIRGTDAMKIFYHNLTGSGGGWQGEGEEPAVGEETFLIAWEKGGKRGRGLNERGCS